METLRADVARRGSSFAFDHGVASELAAALTAMDVGRRVLAAASGLRSASRAALPRAPRRDRWLPRRFPAVPGVAGRDREQTPLQASFERARDTGVPDQMPLFHYDVRDHECGELVHRAWSLIRRLTERAREDVWARLDVVEADLFARSQELRAALSAPETATRRLAGMAQVALHLAATQTNADLVATVAGAGLTAPGADGGAIALRDGVRGTVRVTMTEGLGERARRGFATLPRDSRLPAAWVARTGQPLVLGGRAAGLAWSPAMAEVYAETARHAWIAVPLRVGDRLLGVAGGRLDRGAHVPP